MVKLPRKVASLRKPKPADQARPALPQTLQFDDRWRTQTLERWAAGVSVLQLEEAGEDSQGGDYEDA